MMPYPKQSYRFRLAISFQKRSFLGVLHLASYAKRDQHHCCRISLCRAIVDASHHYDIKVFISEERPVAGEWTPLSRSAFFSGL